MGCEYSQHFMNAMIFIVRDHECENILEWYIPYDKEVKKTN